MIQNRCINIDWLEVYALEDLQRYPCDADYFEQVGFLVQRREYGTRVYREMFTLCDWHHEPLYEVRRNPYSEVGKDGGLFPPNSCHIKLSNRMCYCNDPVGTLRNFMCAHNYTLEKIFRIDICLDFEKFDKGDNPADMIVRYLKGKYSKINQCNINAHGVDRWDGRVWNSLSWGQPKSMVSTKLYCKSLELQQVKQKPYINATWFDALLVDDPINLTKRKPDGSIYKPDIYRVEFSIKSSAKKVFVIDKTIGKKRKIEMPHTLDMYDSKPKLETMFASLAQHYFRFKYYEDGVRKDRCKDKVLFEFSPRDTFYKLDRLASHKSNTRPAERLITLLANYKLTHPDADITKHVDALCHLIRTEILKDMNEIGTTTAEIKALQMLISERIQGVKNKSIAKRLEELKTVIEEQPAFF